MRRKKKKRFVLKSWVIVVIILMSLGGLLYSGYKIYEWKKSTGKNDLIKEEVKEYIKVIYDEEVEENKYEIDFKALKEINSDTVGYIKVKNTNIDYVVVRGNDNSYYLNHNFNQEYNVAGWIFADYRNKFDESDKNIIIYGHNMYDGSMFESLRSTLNKEWQENKDNLEVLFITEDGENLYQVFSTYMIIPEDYYITTEFNSESEYMNFLNTIKNRSNYDYDVNITSDDKILTLSTCSVDGSMRIVMHAKKIVTDSLINVKTD